MFHVAPVETAEINPGCQGSLRSGGSVTASMQKTTTNECWPLSQARRGRLALGKQQTLRTAHQPSLGFVLSPWKLSIKQTFLEEVCSVRHKMRFILPYQASTPACHCGSDTTHYGHHGSSRNSIKTCFCIGQVLCPIEILSSGSTHTHTHPSRTPSA